MGKKTRGKQNIPTAYYIGRPSQLIGGKTQRFYRLISTCFVLFQSSINPPKMLNTPMDSKVLGFLLFLFAAFHDCTTWIQYKSRDCEWTLTMAIPRELRKWHDHRAKQPATLQQVNGISLNPIKMNWRSSFDFPSILTMKTGMANW